MLELHSLDLEPSAAGAVVLLAVLQGLTEFLPISSSGHLVLTEAALDLPQGDLLALNVALHAGTLAAVLLVYGRDLLRVLGDARRGNPRVLLLLFVGSLPAALAGILLKPVFDELLTKPDVAAGGLLGTSVLLLVGEAGRRRLHGGKRSKRLTSVPLAPGESREGEDPARGAISPRVGYLDALLIGALQAIAILPGISRSGATIAGGMLCGLSASEAARFSFLLSIPAVGGAALLELPGLFDGSTEGLPVGLVLVGAGLAAIVGWASLRGLLSTLARGAFLWFALYCAVLGGLVLSAF